MNILYCKSLWWPFGSHLMHTMQRKRFCDLNGYKLLYTQHDHPAYSLYKGRISSFFKNLSDIDDEEIIQFADKNYAEANHKKHFLLKYNDEKKFQESEVVELSTIDTIKWHEYKPENYSSIEDYASSVMQKIAEPSENIKNYLHALPFIQEVTSLNRNYIAVHIRWTDKVTSWTAEADFYDVDVYFKYAIELRDKYGTNNIVLNCDNVDALNKFLAYNIENKLCFNIFYDKEESLPPNDWNGCLFQKNYFQDKSLKKDDYIKDVLNGFKIYKTIFESDSVICNYFSNMALAPIVARNCKKDINISNKTPYAIFPAAYWPNDMFSEEVIKKRVEGDKELSKLLEK